MIIILEIILTIVAYYSGWKWKSLIPLGSLLALGFVIGYVYNIFEYSIESLRWLGLLDLFAVIILGVMCFITPKNKIKNKKDEIK